MSGLFGALIDSALGSAPLLLPRPGRRFAPIEPEQPVPEVAAEESRERPAAEPRPGEARPAGVGHRVAPELPDPSPRNPIRAPETPGRPKQVAERGREEPAKPSVRSRPAEPRTRDGRRPVDSVAPRRPEAQEPQAAPAPLSLPPRVLEPLLPEAIEKPLAGRAAREPEAPRRPPTGPEPFAGPSDEEEGGTPRFELRIGRIEISAASKPPAPKPSARATAIPRARPRQSLDDYLSRRRR